MTWFLSISHLTFRECSCATLHFFFQLQRSEDVHLVVHPGTYAVTTGEWGTMQQQTHVVKVDAGQSVNLDFVL